MLLLFVSAYITWIEQICNVYYFVLRLYELRVMKKVFQRHDAYVRTLSIFLSRVVFPTCVCACVLYESAITLRRFFETIRTTTCILLALRAHLLIEGGKSE